MEGEETNGVKQLRETARRSDDGGQERGQKGEGGGREERSARRPRGRGGMKKQLVNSAHLKKQCLRGL